MKKEFWDEKWQQRQIGFHQSLPHPQLIKGFEGIFSSTRPESVFVPLCGKSLDLIWLAQRVEKVVGIEFNKTAIEEFFAENKLSIEEEGILGGLPFYRSQNIIVIEGDIFDLNRELDHSFQFIYDRAAIVALDPKTRSDYASKLTSLTRVDAQILMICFEYDQSKVAGPPFCVPEAQVSELFSKEFFLKKLNEKSEKPKSPKFVEANVEQFKQTTYQLEKLT
jgi:thiopurine S-methyltransferase